MKSSGLLLVLMETLFLVSLVYTLFYLLEYKEKLDSESISPYECGFDSGSVSRFGFSFRFFLVSILFLVFDVEISLMLPVPFLNDSVMGMWIFYLFVLVLIVGLLYEYWWGALEWVGNFVSKA